MEFKDLKEAGDYIEKLEKERMFHKSDIMNLIENVNAVSDVISTGTINSGDAATDTIIENLRTGFNSLKDNLNKLIGNIGRQ